ncbi:MBL fold metallo-hydrolase [bacterium]|nr:MBL fold metallo-hydrolase [bacterium]
MELQIFGAAREVTGSMHMLTVSSKKILLDCGLFQGRRSEAFERNKNLPFDPKSVDVMVLSHAHIDHSGNIPQLVKNGYEGSVFCTHATQDLSNIMLRDSAHIQEKDVEYVNKKHKKKGLPPVEALYVMKDAEKCLTQFVGLGYERSFPILPNVNLTFHDAGHILGSAVVVLDIDENGKKTRLTFTGDLGRKNLPIIKDPVQVTETDLLITESTYGNRFHEPFGDMKSMVQKVVNETVKRGGKIIVPSFSVGRTQELVYMLHQLVNEGLLPEIPIFVDSPLSVNATEIFRLHNECFDEETREEFLSNHQDPFGFYRLRYIRNVEESKKLNTIEEPCMIISASGMCEAGRIIHHLSNNAHDPKNTILIIGFMAENTLGRRIAEKQPVIKVFGDEIQLRAQVEVMHGFSAHADQNELMDYYRGMNKNRIREVFVVHGEPESSRTLADLIQSEGIKNVHVPVRGEKFQI